MTYPIIAAGACALWSIYYIWTEYNKTPKCYFFTKMVNSLLFLTVGILSLIFGDTMQNYAYFILAALFLGLVGDLFLVFPDSNKLFISGLISFLLGQIVYAGAFVYLAGVSFFDIAVYIAVLTICLMIFKLGKIEFGELKKAIIAYTLIISLMYAMAVSLIYKGGQKPLTVILIAAGATLFLASDAVLAFVKFKKDSPKILRGLNLVLYYSAQVLLALSIASF